MYNEFSTIYDRLMADLGVSYKEWSDYILKVLGDNLKEKTVLEVACGTGNISEYICKHVKELDVMDLSSEMLSIAEQRMRKDKNVHFYRSNMLDMRFNKKYNIIYSSGDSVNYLKNLEEFKKFLENAYNHLAPDGLLTFDMKTLSFISDYRENTDIFEFDDLVCIYNSDIEDNKVIHDLQWFSLEEDNLYSRHFEYQEQYLYSSEAIKKLLLEVGFKDIIGFSFNSLVEGDEREKRIQFFAKK